MTENHFFYVFRWCKVLMPTRLMDRWVSNPFPLVASAKSLSVVPQNTRGWTQDGSFSLLGMDGSYYGWGSFHPGAILLQVEGIVARKSFSPLLYFMDSLAS